MYLAGFRVARKKFEKSGGSKKEGAASAGAQPEPAKSSLFEAATGIGAAAAAPMGGSPPPANVGVTPPRPGPAVSSHAELLDNFVKAQNSPVEQPQTGGGNGAALGMSLSASTGSISAMGVANPLGSPVQLEHNVHAQRPPPPRSGLPPNGLPGSLGSISSVPGSLNPPPVIPEDAGLYYMESNDDPAYSGPSGSHSPGEGAHCRCEKYRQCAQYCNFCPSHHSHQRSYLGDIAIGVA